MITVGCDRASSLEALQVAAELPEVHATVGLHPHEARHGVDDDRRPVRPVARWPWGSAASTTTTTTRRATTSGRRSPPRSRSANRLGLPLVIHTREAWDDTFAILDAEGVPARTIFHCFTGGPDEARRCLDRGAYVSFSGIVTFPGAPEVREAAALVPLERTLVETDSPYLAPVPHRGKRNRPAWVPHVGAQLADVHGVPVERRSATATRRRGDRPRLRSAARGS